MKTQRERDLERMEEIRALEEKRRLADDARRERRNEELNRRSVEEARELRLKNLDADRARRETEAKDKRTPEGRRIQGRRR